MLPSTARETEETLPSYIHEVSRSSNDNASEIYGSLAETMRSNSISEVIFSSYFEDDSDVVDFIQVVPYDGEINGHGSFNLSIEEFQMIQREFPEIDFKDRKALEPRFARHLKENGVTFPLSDSDDKKDLRLRLGALEATIQTCQRRMTEIAEALGQPESH